MRFLVLIAVALTGIWFGIVDNDWLDRRPVERVLYLGDSYAYYNDMPAMVGEMADSAGSPVRYDIVMRAFANAGLKEHWNSSKTQELLAEGNWNRIIIQPEAFLGLLRPESDHFSYGRRLFEAAAPAQPVIIASWTASESHYAGENVTRPEHLRIIDSNVRALASRTGAPLIDVAHVWDDVSAQELPFSLYHEDGNHPSLEGSYLAALVIFAQLTRLDVANVSYVPWRMEVEHAELLRERVRRSLQVRGMGSFFVRSASAMP